MLTVCRLSFRKVAIKDQEENTSMLFDLMTMENNSVPCHMNVYIVVILWYRNDEAKLISNQNVIL